MARASLTTLVMSWVIRRFQSGSLTTFLPRASARLFLADRFPWSDVRPSARDCQCALLGLARSSHCREKLDLYICGVPGTTASAYADLAGVREPLPPEICRRRLRAPLVI